MEEYIIRFFAGAFLVSIFSCLGDVLLPQNIRRSLRCRPLHAIATLLITYVTKGATVVVTEARSMVIGGAALAAYSFATCKLIKRYELTGLQATLVAAVVWFGVAFGLAWVLLGTS
jgi:hypothetical protein